MGASMGSKLQRPVFVGAILLVGLWVVGGRAEAQAPQSATSIWKMVWSDEFNGPDGSPVDSSKWVSETGGGGWGNNELEHYTNRLENAFQQDGSRVIKVLQEKYLGSSNTTRDYTSARLKTQGKFSQAYGR